MPSEITATLPSGAKESLFVDVFVSEGYANNATITEAPVESGANVSDHIRQEAEQLHLDVIVTNSPLQSGVTVFTGIDPLTGRMTAVGSLAFASTPTAPRNPTAAEEAHATLVRWQGQGALLSVETTMGLRESMAIASIGLTRDAKTGGPPGLTGACRIALGLKQIRIVKNKLTTITVSKDPRLAGKVKNGNQPTTPTDPDELHKSVLGRGTQVVTQSLSQPDGALRPVGVALGIP